MAESTMPEPPSGGNTKYAIIGVVLLGAAIAAFLAMNCEDEPVVEALPDAGTGRSTALQEADLVIPDPEPDAGPEVDSGQPRTKIVYRYIPSDWDCSGEIPSSAAHSVINANRRQVRSCYERALKRNHTLAGTLALRLRVGQQGQVTAVNVGGSLREPEVFSCVRNLANQWHFPSPTGGRCAVIAQSFAMNPQQ